MARGSVSRIALSVQLQPLAFQPPSHSCDDIANLLVFARIMGQRRHHARAPGRAHKSLPFAEISQQGRVADTGNEDTFFPSDPFHRLPSANHTHLHCNFLNEQQSFEKRLFNIVVLLFFFNFVGELSLQMINVCFYLRYSVFVFI